MGDAMGNHKFDGLSEGKRGTPASGSHDEEPQITDWSRAVAMIAAKHKPALVKSKPKDRDTRLVQLDKK